MVQKFSEILNVDVDALGLNNASDVIFTTDCGTVGFEFEFCGSASPIEVSVSGELNKHDVARNVKAIIEYLVESPGLLLELLECYPASYAEVKSYFEFMNTLKSA